MRTVICLSGWAKSGPPKADEMVQWTISSDERRELGRAAGPPGIGTLSLPIAAGLEISGSLDAEIFRCRFLTQRQLHCGGKELRAVHPGRDFHHIRHALMHRDF